MNNLILSPAQVREELKPVYLEKLVCENCGLTIGALSQECSNEKCRLYHQKQGGIKKIKIIK